MIFDLVLVLILLAAAVNGWRLGAMSMILSIVVLAAAIFLAIEYAGKIGDLLHIGPDSLRPAIGFIFTFIVVMILGGWIRHLVRPKVGLLRGLDGILGASLGFLRGTAVLAIILGLLSLIHFPPTSWSEHSHLYPLLLRASGWISTKIGLTSPW